MYVHRTYVSMYICMCTEINKTWEERKRKGIGEPIVYLIREWMGMVVFQLKYIVFSNLRVCVFACFQVSVYKCVCVLILSECPYNSAVKSLHVSSLGICWYLKSVPGLVCQ